MKAKSFIKVILIMLWAVSLSTTAFAETGSRTAISDSPKHEIIFSQDDDLFTDSITIKARNDWKKAFENVAENYPEWAKYVKEVHFVNDLDANYAISFTNITKSNYGVIKIKAGNNPIKNPTNLTFHEIAHIIDTYDDLSTRSYYAAYTGVYSNYRKDGKNFCELWRNLEDDNKLSSNIREAFAIAVGRTMYNSIYKNSDNLYSVPDALVPYMEQFIHDISAGYKADLPKAAEFELPLIDDPALIKKLESTVEKYYPETRNTGVSVGIIKDGKVFFSYRGGGITENTIFEIGSITKTFTGTILADLANCGKISLDDPLEKYFDFPIAEFEGTAIKLIDLATHTSGLPRLPMNYDFEGKNPYENYSTDMLLEYLSSAKPASKPGEVYEYSNLGMAILGHVIEQVTGMSYQEVVEETICNKLGMKNTTFFLTPEQEKLRAVPHLRNGNVTNAWTLNIFNAAGGLKSSAYDMVRYMAAGMGQIAAEDDRLQKAFGDAQEIYWMDSGKIVGHDMGLGWRRGRFNNSDSLTHSGSTRGYRTQLRICAEKNIGIIILCNNGGVEDLNDLSRDLMRVLMKD